MLVELGKFVEAEAVIDLGVPGLQVTLANGPHNQAALKVIGVNRLETPVSASEELLVYSLLPSGKPTSVEDGISVWSWVANYYWEPPTLKRVMIRKAAITLARVTKSDYRMELEVAGATTQYVLDRATNRLLEEAYKLTRQSL